MNKLPFQDHNGAVFVFREGRSEEQRTSRWARFVSPCWNTLSSLGFVLITIRFVDLYMQRRLSNNARLCTRLIPLSSVEARELLAAGKVKYESGDRMGALKLWEDVPLKNPDDQERITALYNCTCVHAGFGDVELAQITLRDAVLQGLDFKETITDPESFDEDAVKFIASQQVQIRLKKFSEAALKAAAQKQVMASSKSSRPVRRDIMQDDLTDVLETDMSGIDTSVFGIVKRVVTLLAVLSGAGVALWLVGLNYLFPDTQ